MGPQLLLRRRRKLLGAHGEGSSGTAGVPELGGGGSGLGGEVACNKTTVFFVLNKNQKGGS